MEVASGCLSFDSGLESAAGVDISTWEGGDSVVVDSVIVDPGRGEGIAAGRELGSWRGGDCATGGETRF